MRLDQERASSRGRLVQAGQSEAPGNAGLGMVERVGFARGAGKACGASAGERRGACLDEALVIGVVK